MSLRRTIPAIPIPQHIQSLADQFMTNAQTRFGHGTWVMTGGGDGVSGSGSGEGGDGGGDGGSGEGSGEGDGSGSGSGSGDGSGGQGNGFPADTPVAQMTESEQAAYWRHESKKHQGRYQKLTGGRSYDETRADLDAYAEIRKSQQTPADQALNERYEQGKKDAALESSTKAATAILRANLRTRFAASGLEGAALDSEISDTLDVIDVRKFITDDGDIDTDRMAAAANRFGAGSGSTSTRRRDFGGGSRGGAGGTGKRAGESEADRRFGARKEQ